MNKGRGTTGNASGVGLLVSAQGVLTGRKQTEAGGIPSGWILAPIREIAPLQRGFDLPTSQLRPGPHPVVYSNGVLQHHERAMVKGPGVVTGRSGTIGKVHFVEKDYWPHNTTLWVTSFRENDPKFIYYLYIHIDLAQFLSGSGVPTLNRNDVHQHLVACPSLPDQRAIAEALSDVDGLLGALETLIAKKRAIKQAAMQQLLTGKTRLPGFSGVWEIGKLAESGVFRSGNGFPLVFQGRQFGDYPFFKVSDINNKGNELLLKSANHWISEDVRRTLGATKFSAGSIVFPKIGAAIFLERKRLLSRESCLDNNMMAFSLTAPGSCEQFFHYLFLRIELGKLVSTTALPSLSSREIGAISVLLPPPDEQRAIATVLSDMDAEIAALERRRDKTRAIKQGMMQQLLTGRVRLVKSE